MAPGIPHEDLASECMVMSFPCKSPFCYSFPGVSGTFPFPEFLSTDRNQEHSLNSWRTNQREDTLRICWRDNPYCVKSRVGSTFWDVDPGASPSALGPFCPGRPRAVTPQTRKWLVTVSQLPHPLSCPVPESRRQPKAGKRGFRNTTFFIECLSQRKFSVTTNAGTRAEAQEERSVYPHNE